MCALSGGAQFWEVEWVPSTNVGEMSRVVCSFHAPVIFNYSLSFTR
jgi:hypothetical protein